MTNISYAPGEMEHEIQDIRRRAEALVRGLTPEQLTMRPEPGKWSIAECLAHLNVTAATVQPFIAKGIARGKREKLFGKGAFKLGARGRFLVWLAEPPPKVRMPAPKSVAPPVTIADPAKLLPDFMHVQDEWIRLMKEAEGLDQARIKMGSLLSPFRCRLCASFPWMMAHQRRHLVQAENVKKTIAPAAQASSAVA
jgi:hypothetical protein